MKICFATNNSNKLYEVRQLLASTPFEVVSLRDIGCTEDIVETADTIEGNSALKAEYVFRNYKLPCFADDTGLEVDALDGAPGVYSARFAGPQRSASDNNSLLLQRLQGATDRSARFKTVISWVNSEGLHQFTGIVNGKILTELAGTDGFGYDPLFVPDGFTQSFAQMTLEQKNRISHRALATRKFIDYLAGL